MNRTKTCETTPFGHVADAIDHLASAFSAAGLEHAREDARTLVRLAAGLSSLDLLTSPSISLRPEIADQIAKYMERRLAREPVSRIQGRRDFWNVSLQVRPGVLDPRADTERLVEVCLSRIAARGRPISRVLDVGVGSGAILCALLTDLPHAKGVGLDISLEACEAARQNLRDLKLDGQARIVHSDFRDYAESGFDLIVANPPYIRSKEIAGLDPEVALYDPRVALDGGADGLDAYRAIAAKVPVWLRPEGILALEIGFDQGASVLDIFSKARLRDLTLIKDYNGLDRVVSGLAPLA